MADYYELLGVARDAGAGEIKKAYRKLALKYHPDRNEGSKDSEERFKEITRAYEILRDPEKRQMYDRYGEQGVRGAAGGQGFQGFDFADALEVFMRDFGGGFGGLGDLFGQRRGGRSGPRKGQTLKVRLPLTLTEVVTGTTRKVQVAVLDTCDRCAGTGAEEGHQSQPCATCGGTGEERVVHDSVMGRMVAVQPCRRCGGEGRVIEHPCSRCRGEGRVRGRREVEVEVPPGVTSENYITLRGQGNAGPRGGPPGDIVVLLDVEEDPRFIRDGANLLMELPITFGQAALGDDVTVATVEGTVRLTVPAGTQAGTMLRLRGQGLPELHDRGRGDLLVRLAVYTPERLTNEQEALFKRLRALEDPAPERVDREDNRGFWSRVKEAFTAG
jgi:molecular chaperone DnaJ